MCCRAFVLVTDERRTRAFQSKKTISQSFLVTICPQNRESPVSRCDASRESGQQEMHERQEPSRQMEEKQSHPSWWLDPHFSEDVASCMARDLFKNRVHSIRRR